MKILIEKTSDLDFKYAQECNSLQECVDELLSNKELYHNTYPEVVVSKPDDITSKDFPDCDYVVEIYDTWRE